MTKSFIIGLIAFALWLPVAVTSALEFAADRVVRIGPRQSHTRVFYRENMWRMEYNQPGAVQVTIVRKDRDLVWHLLPVTRHFKTMPFDSQYALFVAPKLNGELSREVVGTQTMDGRPTTLYEVIVATPDAGSETYYQWVATDINFPLRLTKKDGDWTVEYRHVRIGPTPDFLFQLPHGYGPIDLP